MLSVKDLSVEFRGVSGAPFEAVKHINFLLHKEETLAIVGESGSGKSVATLALTQLLPRSPICRVSGDVRLNGGENLLTMTKRQIQKVRGASIAYIFQNPSTALNPSLTAGFQIAEAVQWHQPGKDARVETLDLLHKVGLSSQHYKAYPFELSGGMQQRVMVAMALACNPKILVADEPTTALDVTLQRQMIDLLKHLRQTEHLAVIFITHNLSLIKNFSDNVLVMFKGEIVEQGATEKILQFPQHPYTRALLECIPSLDHFPERLKSIEEIY